MEEEDGARRIEECGEEGVKDHREALRGNRLTSWIVSIDGARGVRLCAG